MSSENGEVRGSLKAENRIKRRFARFKQRKDLKTRDPLMAELALAQIDATLSVSHAIQELIDQFGEAGLEVMRQQPRFFGAAANHEVRIREAERDIKSIRQSLGVLRDEIRRKTNSDTVTPEPVSPSQPWWAFWRGW